MHKGGLKYRHLPVQFIQHMYTRPKKFLNTYIFNNNINTGDRTIIKLGLFVGQHLILAYERAYTRKQQPYKQ